MSLEGALAAHRFGLGARPGEIESASADPKAWLTDQLNGPVPQPTGAGLMTTGQLMAVAMDRVREYRQERTTNEPQAKKIFHESRDTYRAEIAARFAHGFTTTKPFVERLVWFWSNHLAVSVRNTRTYGFVGAYEREAIRPHVLGRFENMLLASARHPAMQYYLDNYASVGPNSQAGAAHGRGLNENYGRELMELHTLGVDGGYSQADVIALAKLLTGWSVDREMDSPGANGFRYYPQRHEPGDVTVLGRTYPPTEEGGVQAIRDLANHPKTAVHIARKFAQHIIAENPPQASVDRLAQIFRATGGDLKAMTMAAIDDPIGWAPSNTRIRPPVEYLTAIGRAMNWPGSNTNVDRARSDSTLHDLIGACQSMGQVPLAPLGPNGWPDSSNAWSGADAILTRVEFAARIGNRSATGSDPMRVAQSTLGPMLSNDTHLAITRAASPAQGLALVFASPEFQRR
jgi:uncharacterized protein (DUF1800 family)